jgi:hypothetical protein
MGCGVRVTERTEVEQVGVDPLARVYEQFEPFTWRESCAV